MTHLPWSPLAAVLERRHLSMAQLARLANTTRRTVLRYKAAGSLPERAADRVAVALGLTPDAVWGEAAWAEATSALVAKAEAADAKAAKKAAEVRAKQAAAKRRYRRAHPDYAARQREIRQEWGARNRAAEARRNADYEDANRAALNEANRLRWAADPEAYRAKQRAYRAGRKAAA